MINYEELEKLGLDTGFSHIAPLKCSTIELLPEVRQMCEANTCGMYGKRWSCPPGCGLKDCRNWLFRLISIRELSFTGGMV